MPSSSLPLSARGRSGRVREWRKRKKVGRDLSRRGRYSPHRFFTTPCGIIEEPPGLDIPRLSSYRTRKDVIRSGGRTYPLMFGTSTFSPANCTVPPRSQRAFLARSPIFLVLSRACICVVCFVLKLFARNIIYESKKYSIYGIEYQYLEIYTG